MDLVLSTADYGSMTKLKFKFKLQIIDVAITISKEESKVVVNAFYA